MSGSAQPLPQSRFYVDPPAAVPVAGDWMASLSDYGDMSYLLLPTQANRTLSVAVTRIG